MKLWKPSKQPGYLAQRIARDRPQIEREERPPNLRSKNQRHYYLADARKQR
jgi:hypothetical protein